MAYLSRFIFLNLCLMLCSSQVKLQESDTKTDFGSQKVIPFFEISGDFFDEKLPGMRSQKNKEVMQTPFVDQTRQPLDVKVYFASSCNHCSDFFRDNENGLSKIINDLVKPGYIKFSFRPLVLYAADLAILRLCMNHSGDENQRYEGFEKKFTLFLQNQSQWIGYLQAPNCELESDKDECKTEFLDQKASDQLTFKFKEYFLRKRAEKWNIQIDEENKNLSASEKETLAIHPSNANASVILFARGVLKMSQEEIRVALNANDTEAFTQIAFATQSQAKKNATEPIDAVPAFFVNGEFKGVLNYQDLKKIAKKED